MATTTSRTLSTPEQLVFANGTYDDYSSVPDSHKYATYTINGIEKKFCHPDLVTAAAELGLSLDDVDKKKQCGRAIADFAIFDFLYPAGAATDASGSSTWNRVKDDKTNICACIKSIDAASNAADFCTFDCLFHSEDGTNRTFPEWVKHFCGDNFDPCSRN